MKVFDRIAHWTQVRIRWATIVVKRIVRFITHDMWYLNMEDLSRWKKRGVEDLKTIFVMLKVFSDQKIGYQITALAYQSMMSVVPFIAIGLYLTNGIGIADQFSAFLHANISNQRLINYLLAASEKIITTAESGLFGFISMASFLWILLSLMLTVRRVFNNVWQAKEKRSFFRVLGIGIAILILSPFVIVLFFSGSVVYSTVLDYIVPSGPDGHVQVSAGGRGQDASGFQGGAHCRHRFHGRAISLPGDAGPGGQAERHLRRAGRPPALHDLAEPGMDDHPVRS